MLTKLNEHQTQHLEILKHVFKTDNFNAMDLLIPAKKKEVFNFKHRYLRDSIPSPQLVTYKVRRALSRVADRVRHPAALGQRRVKPEVIQYSRLGGAR